ncbi:TPR repeat-containing protein YrrB [Anaerolineae bacterium]|nr:TPR repeat-containing protein YrrB [Anaerolineae bacterium]
MANDHDASTHFLDFDLEIAQGTGRDYPVAVVRSPAGEARATMRFPFDELALENRLKDLQIALLRSGGKRRQVLTAEESKVQDFGKQLFDALIVGEIRSRYDVSHREATMQGNGLRLKLRIASPELAALPWEFLYDSRQAEYVCLSTNTPVVRYIELPQPIQPLIVAPPLRVLGMIASPSDLPELNTANEKQRIEEATRDLQTRGLIQVTWLAGQTWRDLQRAMRTGAWHIFHFIGHGGFDRQADEGLIAFADDAGKSAYFNATQLGRLLADHRSLRLVLLNSCEGARGSDRDLFSSTASILVRRGIPAVLAMQYEITDRAAIEFARTFYDSLADGLPVDAATAEARKAISFAVANTIEWGTPVLFMRAPDGMLFRLQVQTDAKHCAQEAEHLEKARQEREVRDKQAREQNAKQIPELTSQLAQAESQSDWDKVIELGERILELDANHQLVRSKTAEAYDSRSTRYHQQDNYTRAIEDNSRAIELDPNKADYYYSRGLSYQEKQDYDHAIADYNRAIELDPNQAKYYYSRGLSYHNAKFYGYAIGDYDRAIADRTNAIELNPNNAEYYATRGGSYHEKGDYARAIEDRTHAIELDPNNADYYQSRGNSYSWINEYDKAIADHSKAIQLDSTKPDYYWERGKRYSRKNDYDHAIADYNRAIELDPSKAGYYFERGKSYHSQSDYDRAIADKTRAIKLEPDKAEYYYSRGLSYHQAKFYKHSIGNYDHAIADYNRAIELDPSNAKYYEERGRSYNQQENYARAITDKTYAIQLAPNNPVYYYSRGLSYKWKGDKSSARYDFQRAADMGHEKAKEELANL